MASTAAYNLWDNHRYSIANFNFSLTFAAVNRCFAQAGEIFPKINVFQQCYVRKQELVNFCAWTPMSLWCGVFLRPIAARLSNCPPFFVPWKLRTFSQWKFPNSIQSRKFNILLSMAAFEKSCRLISLIWSPLLPFVYSIETIRSIWICVRLLHRDYSEHDLNARSPDFERSKHSVVHIKDGGRKWWLCFTCRWNNNVFHRQVRKCKISRTLLLF